MLYVLRCEDQEERCIKSTDAEALEEFKSDLDLDQDDVYWEWQVPKVPETLEELTACFARISDSSWAELHKVSEDSKEVLARYDG